jgi:hypothetical protein
VELFHDHLIWFARLKEEANGEQRPETAGSFIPGGNGRVLMLMGHQITARRSLPNSGAVHR